jgi:glycosyltransferase involved in cell wall biosynthesis
MNRPVLSICINTRNRGNLIAETLDSFLDQMIPGVEIVVVDGASADETEKVMQRYAERHSCLRYVRSESNLGVDDGYDLAVGMAAGEYCWLFPDDDLIVPGALKSVVNHVQAGPDLVVLNVECFTKDLRVDLNQRLFPLPGDRDYGREQFSEFLTNVGFGLSYIGCVVIKREIWQENDRSKYYGTYFVHMGVICESTQIDKIRFLSEPLIKYRSGNSSWTARSFEIWYIKWPELIWACGQLAPEVKQSVVSRNPWSRGLTLLKSRAMGEYDYSIFRRHLAFAGSLWERARSLWISILPVVPLNLLLVTFCLVFRRKGLYTIYNLMVSSPSQRLSRAMVRLFGLKALSMSN